MRQEDSAERVLIHKKDADDPISPRRQKDYRKCLTNFFVV
jgi:hypothetical protein